MVQRTDRFRSGDGLFAVDGQLRIVSWNRAAEELTGSTAEEAIGRRCWEVLGGTEEDGALVCHTRCSFARLMSDGWPVRSHDLRVRTKTGSRRVVLSTIELTDEQGLFLHVMRSAPERTSEGSSASRFDLTPRQLQVLELVSDGLAAKAIATRLGITLPTVRNHIRAILLELGAHSQLEAVATARRHGLLQR